MRKSAIIVCAAVALAATEASAYDDGFGVVTFTSGCLVQYSYVPGHVPLHGSGPVDGYTRYVISGSRVLICLAV
jgi:hypothetical protein